MKNSIKRVVITAWAAVIGFAMAACSDGGGGGSPGPGPGPIPTGGDGSIDFSSAKTYSVIGKKLEITFEKAAVDDMSLDDSPYESLSSLLETGYEVKLATDGTFTLKLTDVKTERLYSATYSNIKGFWGYTLSGDFITKGGKLLITYGFLDSSKAHWISWDDSTSLYDKASDMVFLVYADKDGTLKGTHPDGDIVDWRLKAGWNMVIDECRDDIYYSTTGKPGSSLNWHLNEW